MDIQATTDFKHGKVKFEKGRCYSVPEGIGGYFVGVGWAKPTEGGPYQTVDPQLLDPNAPAPKREGDTLEVQDLTIKVEG